MARNVPTGPPPPLAVQKLRLRYTKRGRLRFTSHRDIARAFERALRRAQVPMAYSAGFSPHPKISWVGAAPTGVASEAEYVEISVVERVDLVLFGLVGLFFLVVTAFFILDDVDAHLGDFGHHVLDLLGRHMLLGEGLVDLVDGDEPTLLGPCLQFLDGSLVLVDQRLVAGVG